MSTWMVVEDEPDIYEVLLAMFEMWGIDGVAFVDGDEAIKWIEEVDSGEFEGELPELALLDIRLPGSISGPMVGERLRKSPRLRNSTIVLTTAYHLSKAEEKASRALAGADDIIYKPLPKFNELKKKLEKILGERRAKNKKMEAVPTPQPKVVAHVRTAKPTPPATLPEVEAESDADTVPTREEEK